MTNRERLNSLTDEDYAHWLCRQLWEDYDADDVINVIRYNQVRNFLKMEYKEKDNGAERVDRSNL